MNNELVFEKIIILLKNKIEKKTSIVSFLFISDYLVMCGSRKGLGLLETANGEENPVECMYVAY